MRSLLTPINLCFFHTRQTGPVVVRHLVLDRRFFQHRTLFECPLYNPTFCLCHFSFSSDLRAIIVTLIDACVDLPAIITAFGGGGPPGSSWAAPPFPPLFWRADRNYMIFLCKTSCKVTRGPVWQTKGLFALSQIQIYIYIYSQKLIYKHINMYIYTQKCASRNTPLTFRGLASQEHWF